MRLFGSESIRGGKITVRILLVLTALTIFSGCDQAGPQQDEQEGA